MRRLLFVAGGTAIAAAILGCGILAAFIFLSDVADDGEDPAPDGESVAALPASAKIFDECSIVNTSSDDATPIPEGTVEILRFGEAQRLQVGDLEFDYCRWDEAGVFVPVPHGWTAQLVPRIGKLAPGNIGGVRLIGSDALEEVIVTIWVRGHGDPVSDIVYPNPWFALAELYETDIRATRETSLAGRRAAEARGVAARRPVLIQTYFEDGEIWVFGGSSDEASRDAVIPLLERFATALQPIP